MEGLSDYMLLEVFIRLDPTSLKNCTEVCKRWNNLITRSASTMDKLKLKVDDSCKLRDLRDISRRYYNLKLSSISIRSKVCSPLLNCQPNLRKLELNRINIITSDYINMLQSIPTLEDLTIIDCRMISYAKTNFIVKMPLLKKLTISGLIRFLAYINGSAIKKLEFTECFGCLVHTSFVSTLQQLEDLAITSPGYMCLWFAPANVQLKKLVVRIEPNFVHFCDRGYSLVQSNASTLESMEINVGDRSEDYDLTNVAPFNSHSFPSFEEFYKVLVSASSTNYSHDSIASTAKYYIPQLKSMKIYRPRSA